MNNHSQALTQLKAILPEGSIAFLFDQISKWDESGVKTKYQPLALVKPKTQKQIQEILKWANTYNMSIIVRASGTGKAGAVVPINSKTVIIDLSTFSKILEIDIQNKVAVVEPAVILEEFQKAVEAKGLFYPPDPASLDRCSIGGTVATNAGGPRAFKYGVTSDYVMGLEGFLGNGEFFKVGGKNQKDVAGYDFKKIVVGSEGTLAVITKIILKLKVKPKYTECLEIAFESLSQAMDWFYLIQEEEIIPESIEFLDLQCMNALSEAFGYKSVDQAHKAYILVECGESKAVAVSETIKQIKTLAEKSGAKKITEAKTELEKQTLKQKRRRVSESLSKCSIEKYSHDITVPVSRILTYMEFLETLNKKSLCTILGYGHLGDGNIHVNILNPKSGIKNFKKAAQILEEELFKEALKLGGTLSGEHGIGLSKRKYLPKMFSKEELALFKRIKKACDPKSILNPLKAI